MESFDWFLDWLSSADAFGIAIFQSFFVVIGLVLLIGRRASRRTVKKDGK